MVANAYLRRHGSVSSRRACAVVSLRLVVRERVDMRCVFNGREQVRARVGVQSVSHLECAGDCRARSRKALAAKARDTQRVASAISQRSGWYWLLTHSCFARAGGHALRVERARAGLRYWLLTHSRVDMARFPCDAHAQLSRCVQFVAAGHALRVQRARAGPRVRGGAN